VLDSKLQLKAGESLYVSGHFKRIDVKASAATEAKANAIFFSIPNMKEFVNVAPRLKSAAASGKTVWIAYPKAGQLGTDLNRDILHVHAKKLGLQTVRQIAIDDVWSALRLKI
jgi:hypothetical protein